jgi:AcrR family transcriptional regulator
VDADPVRERILEAADGLFYARGIRAVGMDAVRDASNVTLRRLYQLFPTKDELVIGYLARRDARWLQSLAAYVDGPPARSPRERLLAVFDWLEAWFGQPGFHGCAFINAYGELGASAPRIAEAVRRHKEDFHTYLGELAARAGVPADTGTQIALLAEGAMATAAVSGSAAPARQAAQAAGLLLTASRLSAQAPPC